MSLYQVVNGNVAVQLDLNQFHNWLIDGTITDTPLNIVLNSGSGHSLSGTFTGVFFFNIDPTCNNSSGNNIGLAVGPTFGVATTGNLYGLYVNSNAELNVANQLFANIYSLPSATINVGTGNKGIVQSLRLGFNTPSITSGSLDTANSSTLYIASAPSSGYSILDASAGKWQVGTGGLFIGSGVNLDSSTLYAMHATDSSHLRFVQSGQQQLSGIYNAGTTTQYTVTFTKAYTVVPNLVVNWVSVANFNFTGAPIGLDIYPVNISTTGFTINVFNPTGGTINPSNNNYAMWIAEGY